MRTIDKNFGGFSFELNFWSNVINQGVDFVESLPTTVESLYSHDYQLFIGGDGFGMAPRSTTLNDTVKALASLGILTAEQLLQIFIDNMGAAEFGSAYSLKRLLWDEAIDLFTGPHKDIALDAVHQYWRLSPKLMITLVSLVGQAQGNRTFPLTDIHQRNMENASRFKKEGEQSCEAMFYDYSVQYEITNLFKGHPTQVPGVDNRIFSSGF